MRWIIAVLLALAPAKLGAQTVDPEGYVFGGVSISWEDGVTTDEYRTYLAAPGGWSQGWFIGGGFHVTRNISLEGEWLRTGLMEATEPSRYDITYAARRRDTVLAFGPRFHVPQARAVGLEFVGLFEFVREQSWLAQRRMRFGLPPDGSLDDYSPFVNSWSWGIGGGGDVRVGGRHWAVLPGIRYHRVFRGSDATSTWPGGRSSHRLDYTVAARVDF